ncbi:MAG: hypothetical protein M1834_005881 [Cirrosporium novae-zelandiae]|nr:MAG: hypothetical protein M1834_005881 [Cirrosporium novae-zelandiae]
MASNLPPFKRRRLNDALHKPFRSPLKTTATRANQPSADVSTNQSEAGTDEKLGSTSTTVLTTIAKNEIATQEKNDSKTKERSELQPSNTPSRKPSHHPFTPQPHRHTPSHLFTSSRDPTLAHLQSRSLHLSTRLRSINADIDMLNRALTIQNHPEKEEELETLVQKWKVKSREAAEEVFGQVKGRVEGLEGGWKKWAGGNGNNNDGGFGNWGWDDGGKKGEGGGREDDEYAEERRLQEKVQTDNNGEDEHFTMGSMLETLHIDLAVIGYDKVNQRWID